MGRAPLAHPERTRPAREKLCGDLTAAGWLDLNNQRGG